MDDRPIAKDGGAYPVTLDVSCTDGQAGFQCRVNVGTDPGATHHEVFVSSADLARLAPEGTPAELLVEEAFRFLLEREPREAILARFDISVIGRYFPGGPDEIGRRVTRRVGVREPTR